MSPVQEAPPEHTVTLIDELLAEQRTLTAVERFARLHERQAVPAQARFYRDLIPLERPKPGEQYAFEVDLDLCTGCKGCVTACHSLNGLDEHEAWRNVGVLIGGINGEAMQQTVTTACHHCVDPGCLNGCPVMAYEKDLTTGIVRHLDDQCIGCQYCVMKCPYDVPKYSPRLGIVRKCDLCHQRLANGEAPACVQACPNEAIKVSLVNRNATTERHRRGLDVGNPFVVASPAPDYTVPTTIYRTRRSIVGTLRAANESALAPQHAHWPLVFLLVLSQSSVGMTIAAWIELRSDGMPMAQHLVPASTATMAAALGVASLHLGRPFKAWRAFMGWRTSWFSREAIAFGAYLGALTLAAMLAMTQRESLFRWALPLAALLGLIAVFCSLMLYIDTRREFWSALPTSTRFIGTTLLLGIADWLWLASTESPLPRTMLAALPALTLVKLVFEFEPLAHARAREWTPLKRTARLLIGPLRNATALRIVLGFVGGVLLPTLAVLRTIPFGIFSASLLWGLVLGGELTERYLFFTAVSPTQMPGGTAP